MSINVPMATKAIINKTNPCIANGETKSDKPENGLLLIIILKLLRYSSFYIFVEYPGQLRMTLNYLSFPSFLICSLIFVAEIC